MYSNKLDELDGMGKFLETRNLLGINHEATKNPGNYTNKEIESLIKTLPKKEKS